MRQEYALCLPPAACVALFQELPRAPDLNAALCILEQVRQSLLGDGLLTINVNVTPDRAEDEAVELQRLWSSKPGAYPVGGRKHKPMTPWARQLLRRGEIFVGEGDATLAEVFDDHAQMTSMGLHAIVNVPLLAGGRCVATFNVTGSRSQWQPHEVMLTRLLAALATPWVLQSAAGIQRANAALPLA
ncbi:GAF domain-containing protein [Polaromonas sp. OV174]|uniref:GAF domain-containing protein n=1 Tax=Polaromonas sp. OV174 TaxID=1855300 RepID=UPI0008EABF5B|nr:GAF domain-containing protein [Polaromonas sp. OV174]SFC50014.1 GAF domain-containing protein [Polaromonas sp. OV174]